MKQYLIQGLFVVVFLLRTEEVSGFLFDDDGECSARSVMTGGMTCTFNRDNNQLLHLLQLFTQVTEGPYTAAVFLGMIDTFCSEIKDIENCTRNNFSDCDDFQQVFEANLEKRNLCAAAESWIPEYLGNLGDGPIFDGTCLSSVTELTALCHGGIEAIVNSFSKELKESNNPVTTILKVLGKVRDMNVKCLTTMTYVHPQYDLDPQCQNMNPKIAALLVASYGAIAGPAGFAFTAEQFEQIKNMP